MDANTLAKYIGKEHVEEVETLMYQGGVSVFACKLLLCLLTFGVWWIADLGYSVIMTKETNYKKIIAAAA